MVAPTRARKSASPIDAQLREDLEIDVVGEVWLVDDELGVRDRPRLGEHVVGGRVPEVPCPDALHQVRLSHPPAHLPEVGPAVATVGSRVSLGDARIEDADVDGPDRDDGQRPPDRRGPAPACEHDPRDQRRHQPHGSAPGGGQEDAQKHQGAARRSAEHLAAGERVVAARATANTKATTSTAASRLGSAIVPPQAIEVARGGGASREAREVRGGDDPVGRRDRATRDQGAQQGLHLLRGPDGLEDDHEQECVEPVLHQHRERVAGVLRPQRAQRDPGEEGRREPVIAGMARPKQASRIVCVATRASQERASTRLAAWALTSDPTAPGGDGEERDQREDDQSSGEVGYRESEEADRQRPADRELRDRRLRARRKAGTRPRTRAPAATARYPVGWRPGPLLWPGLTRASPDRRRPPGRSPRGPSRPRSARSWAAPRTRGSRTGRLLER